MQICAPRVAQIALPPLLPSLRADIAASARALAARRALFEATVNAVPGWSVASVGAYSAYVAFPAAYARRREGQEGGSEAVAKVLGERVGVVVLPGSFFVPQEDGEQGMVFERGGQEGERMWKELRGDRWLR